jgi:hypothetical protein
VNTQAFLLHKALNHLLRQVKLALSQCDTYPSVAVAAVIALKNIDDGYPSISVFVGLSQASTVVKIGTAGQIERGEQFCARINGFQGVNQQGFLSITQELRIDAQVFLEFHWPSSICRAQAGGGGYGVEASQSGAVVQLCRDQAAYRFDVFSWMRVPHDQGADFSSGTALACLSLASGRLPVHDSGECKGQ